MALLVEISALGADAEYELRSLHRWIGADETLTGACTGTPRASGPPNPDHMGLGFDILEFAVNSGLATGALAVSIASWLDARRGAARLRMTRGRVVVELPADTPEATLAAIRMLFHDGNDENLGTDGEETVAGTDGEDDMRTADGHQQ
ncbi:hypothetical protein ACIBAG_35785 [Streptomyces sp. NPDC051243]|uniref:effector-associated constant component EACC1 n=1 Tax=Streptomyces sp. NPDC051243 TaxID=3365646 RepID=UPI0037B02F9D